MSDPMTVDDLVTGEAAARLGPGVIATAAILIVETMGEDGPGFRYVCSTDLPTWRAIGMIRSAQLHMERDDLEAWDGEGDEL